MSNISTAVVQRDLVNARKGPGLHHAVVQKVQRGEIYETLAEKSEWVKLGYYHGGQEVGWVRRDLVWSCGPAR